MMVLPLDPAGGSAPDNRYRQAFPRSPWALRFHIAIDAPGLGYSL